MRQGLTSVSTHVLPKHICSLLLIPSSSLICTQTHSCNPAGWAPSPSKGDDGPGWGRSNRVQQRELLVLVKVFRGQGCRSPRRQASLKGQASMAVRLVAGEILLSVEKACWCSLFISPGLSLFLFVSLHIGFRSRVCLLSLLSQVYSRVVGAERAAEGVSLGGGGACWKVGGQG